MGGLTDNTFAKPETLPLFNLERPRRDHPIGSHVRADELNEDNAKKITDNMIAVLRWVIRYPGRTAAELGKKMAVRDRSKYEWPHKYLKRLEQAGLVERKTSKDKRRQMTCTATEKAKQFISELDGA